MFPFPDFIEDEFKRINEFDSQQVSGIVEILHCIASIEYGLKQDSKFTIEQMLLFAGSERALELYIKYSDLLNDRDYWRLLGDTYQMTHMSADHKILRLLFGSKRRYRYKLMNKKERVMLKNLPATLTIYRAMTESEAESGKYGISWTLNQKVAQDFLQRNHREEQQKVIKKLIIKKENAICYLEERNEAEIIYIGETEQAGIHGTLQSD